MPVEWTQAPGLYMSTHYDRHLVLLSVVLAMFASYVALDLARRVVRAEGGIAQAWLIGGSLAMGSGIWAMHFVAMMALSLPVPMGYNLPITLLSWVAAVLSSCIALYIASRPRLTTHQLVIGGLSMGAGICAMHYIGMWAMKMVPAIVWDPMLVVASIVIAVGASFAALMIFFWMQSRDPNRLLLPQLVAAALMGIAIAGMHYTGMAAAHFPLGSMCLAASDISPVPLGYAVGSVTFGLLTVTLVTSVLDGRLKSRTAVLVDSLREANAELTRIAYKDALTGLANRLTLEQFMASATAEACRHNTKLPVLFMDLDGFKQVNDSLGHLAGDQVLREVAARLHRTARGKATNGAAQIHSFQRTRNRSIVFDRHLGFPRRRRYGKTYFQRGHRDA